MMKNAAFVDKIIELALAEDLGYVGDITTNSILEEEYVNFAVVAREDLLLSGIEIAEVILDRNKNHIDYIFCKNDGDFVFRGESIIKGRALARIIMPVERTLLNFLQHCSGISSYTRKFVDAVKTTNVIIRSTRKTVPGLRFVEKYAVEVGGGQSYRFNLSDKILIKDNHIAGCGGIEEAILRVKSKMSFGALEADCSKEIAVECDNINQVGAAFSLGVDLILLDNMSIEDLKKSVDICKGKVKLEATGGIALSNVFAVAKTGVDYISVGALTHSFPSVDMGLDIIEFTSPSV